MKGKVVINYDNHAVNVETELQHQELYEAYVGLTATLATQLVNHKDILKMANQAALDAIQMIEQKSYTIGNPNNQTS